MILHHIGYNISFQTGDFTGNVPSLPEDIIVQMVYTNEIYYTDPKFTMFPFFKMHSESISARLAKEKHFIKCFNPKLNVI